MQLCLPFRLDTKSLSGYFWTIGPHCTGASRLTAEKGGMLKIRYLVRADWFMQRHCKTLHQVPRIFSSRKRRQNGSLIRSADMSDLVSVAASASKPDVAESNEAIY